MQYKIPLVLTPQPEGRFTVTSPLLPELVTEGDSAEEALDNVKDARGWGGFGALESMAGRKLVWAFGRMEKCSAMQGSTGGASGTRRWLHVEIGSWNLFWLFSGFFWPSRSGVGSRTTTIQWQVAAESHSRLAWIRNECRLLS